MNELLGNPVFMFNVMYIGGVILVVQLAVNVVIALFSSLNRMVEKRESIERRKALHKVLDEIVKEVHEEVEGAKRQPVKKTKKVITKTK